MDQLQRALKRRDAPAFAAASRSLGATGCEERHVVELLQLDVEQDPADITHFLRGIFPEVYYDEDADTGISAAAPDVSDRALLNARGNKNVSKLMFVHIPKNGGSAVVKAGEAAGEFWGGEAFENLTGLAGRYSPGRRMPDGHLCSWPHVPPRFFSEDESPYTGEVFCVTRDPYERVVSDYRYQAQWAGKWWTEMYWWFGLHRNGMAKKSLCTPVGLNAFVEGTGRLYASGRQYLNDCHTLPQSAYIFKQDGEKWCDHILPLEGLVDSFNRLMREHGSAARLQNSSKSKANVGYMCPELTSADLSNSSRSLIADMYEEDFKRLGFELRD